MTREGGGALCGRFLGLTLPLASVSITTVALNSEQKKLKYRYQEGQ